MLIIITIEKIKRLKNNPNLNSNSTNNNNNNNNSKKFVRFKNLPILSIHIFGLLQDDMYSIQFIC